MRYLLRIRNPTYPKVVKAEQMTPLVELQVEWRADTLLSLMLDCTWPVRHTSFFLDVQK